MHEVKIEITGMQGAGKTRIFNLLISALTLDNYKVSVIDMDGLKGDRAVAESDFNEIIIEARQTLHNPTIMDVLEDGVKLIGAERVRQIYEEGWTPVHDSKYENDELAKASVAYSLPDKFFSTSYGSRFQRDLFWPWGQKWWKPSPDNRIKELAKAGALIAAEIDRLKALEEGEGVSDA